MNRCVIPLRTSVEWFTDPAAPAIVGRAKQAAVLYDEVLFEAGALDMVISDLHSVQFWVPPRGVTPVMLEQLNRPVAVGGQTYLAMGPEPAAGVPAPPEAMRVIASGAVQHRYVAELEYTVLSQIAEFNDGWATVFQDGGADITRIDPHGSIRATLGDLRDTTKTAGSSFLDSFISQSLVRDSALASLFDCDLHLSPMFSRQLAPPAVPRAEGARAMETLSYLFPDVTSLPWDAVMEFRNHDAARAARAELWDLVARAQTEGPVAAEAKLAHDAQALARELGARHKLPQRAANIVISIAVLETPKAWAAVAVPEIVGSMVDRFRARRDWFGALSMLRA